MAKDEEVKQYQQTLTTASIRRNDTRSTNIASFGPDPMSNTLSNVYAFLLRKAAERTRRDGELPAESAGRKEESGIIEHPTPKSRPNARHKSFKQSRRKARQQSAKRKS